MSRLKKTADKITDIPEEFVRVRLAPKLVEDLWWSELTEGNKVVEIWETADATWVVVEGDYSDNDWTQEDVSFVKEFEKSEDASEFVRSKYIVVAHGEEAATPIAEEEKTASVSRLRKN